MLNHSLKNGRTTQMNFWKMLKQRNFEECVSFSDNFEKLLVYSDLQDKIDSHPGKSFSWKSFVRCNNFWSFTFWFILGSLLNQVFYYRNQQFRSDCSLCATCMFDSSLLISRQSSKVGKSNHCCSLRLRLMMTEVSLTHNYHHWLAFNIFYKIFNIYWHYIWRFRQHTFPLIDWFHFKLEITQNFIPHHIDTC